jgi:hypothetical protein
MCPLDVKRPSCRSPKSSSKLDPSVPPLPMQVVIGMPRSLDTPGQQVYIQFHSGLILKPDGRHEKTRQRGSQADFWRVLGQRILIRMPMKPRAVIQFRGANSHRLALNGAVTHQAGQQPDSAVGDRGPLSGPDSCPNRCDQCVVVGDDCGGARRDAVTS